MLATRPRTTPSDGRMRRAAVAVLALVAWAAGCQPTREFYFHEGDELAHYRDVATALEQADVPPDHSAESLAPLAPRTLWNHDRADYWNMTLEEAVRLALANSKVMRDLGGRVITNPQLATTAYDPAIQEADPRFGVEGALSRFDAQVATRMFWERNDRVVNNLFINGGVFELFQDLGTFNGELSKRAATGTLFALRHNVDYDYNNRPVNLFPSAWNVNFEAAVQHPLLRGGGLDFNRIAGPDALPGLQYQNGVLLARVDNDISLAQFEAGVRDLVNDVESLYWDLYFAYRQLDAKVVARDTALATWRRYANAAEQGAGNPADQAQAAARYFTLQAEVEDALSGRTAGGTQRFPGSPSGQFTAAGGLYARESDLRLLLGLPQNDGRLIRPSDEPTIARVAFDWDQTLAEALVRRVELREQKWRIKRRELELVASRNFLLPRLDLLGQYRWRGFGNDLIGYNDPGRFDNAWENLVDGDFQEWQAGFQFSMALGMREGFAAVRQAELRLARERAILAEQEQQVAHDLGAAYREVHRAHELTETALSVRRYTSERVTHVRRQFDEGVVTLDILLEAERDQSNAEVNYFRQLVEYNLAIKAMHYQMGSLLDYCQVYLSEGPWPMKAYQDARDEARRRAAARHLNYGCTVPAPFDAGPIPQQTLPASPLHDALPGVPTEAAPTEAVPPPPGVREPERLPPAASLTRPIVEPVSDRPLDVGRRFAPNDIATPPQFTSPTLRRMLPAGGHQPADVHTAQRAAAQPVVVAVGPNSPNPTEKPAAVQPAQFLSPHGAARGLPAPHAGGSANSPPGGGPG